LNNKFELSDLEVVLKTRARSTSIRRSESMIYVFQIY
jgi:hypothetical protein